MSCGFSCSVDVWPFFLLIIKAADEIARSHTHTAGNCNFGTIHGPTKRAVRMTLLPGNNNRCIVSELSWCDCWSDSAPHFLCDWKLYTLSQSVGASAQSVSDVPLACGALGGARCSSNLSFSCMGWMFVAPSGHLSLSLRCKKETLAHHDGTSTRPQRGKKNKNLIEGNWGSVSRFD